MNYTVVWMPDALNELTRIWTAAADRNAVTAASDRIDRRLAEDPLDVGESRHENYRLGFEPPLQVTFRVDAGQQRVEVTAVGRYGR